LPATLPDRFWAKVDLAAEGGCWAWTARTSNGYGKYAMRVRGKVTDYRAHRLAYQALVGPIPEGFQIDHLCRNRACVNPNHLEIVTGQILCPGGCMASSTPIAQEGTP